MSALRHKKSAVTFRARKVGGRLTPFQVGHQGALQERAVAKVFPLPQAEAICEIELLFVIAVIAPLEILIAVIAIVQYARPSLPDVSADVH